MTKPHQTAYLDNNATTELSEEASQVVMDMVLHAIYGNPSSNHEPGEKIRLIIDAARYGVARSLGCSSEEIVFTSGGTEANNIALRGVYHQEATKPSGIVISAGEHPSIYKTAGELAGPDNTRIIPLLSDGSLDMYQAERLITEDTTLVSVMLANNITGNIYPIKDIVQLAHSRGALVHCDAIQGFGKVPIDVKDLGVDMLSISGHKAHALAGVGALYIRKGIMLHPLFSGGDQEGGHRSGTENYIGIASLATVANEITYQKGKMSPGMRDVFEKGILRGAPGVKINGVDSLRIPNTSSITFPGIHSLSMLTALAEHGVYASAGSACSSGATSLSKTLLSMGLSEKDAASTIRFSFSSVSKLSELILAIEACVNVVDTLSKSVETSEN